MNTQSQRGEASSARFLKPSEIRTTAGTQIRAKLDDDTVAQYASDMQDLVANDFPPVVVFHDGTDYILADGFHRVEAATRNGFKEIWSEIHKGTRANALRWALSANAAHGLRRSNADKRRSVELALAEWPKLSDVELSRICAVGKTMVGEVRRDIQPVEKTGSDTRIGSDGKERRMPVKRTPRPDPEEPPRVVAHTEVMPVAAPVIPPPSSSSPAVPATGQELGGLQAAGVIREFDYFLRVNFRNHNPEQRRWSLRILADHIADLQRGMDAE